MYTLDKNPKLGYYKLGEEIIYGKVDALMQATKKNIFPEWHFNRLIFNTIKWGEEPKTELRELYRLRAQQLRSKYDWIRIEASGGGEAVDGLVPVR